MLIDLIREIVHSIPGIACMCWAGLLIYENYTAYGKIFALQSKYDPEHLFLHYRPSSRLAITSFGVDKTHEKCTPEFLADWNRVYGGHWHRIVLIVLLVPLFGYGSQFLQSIIQQSLTINN